MRSSGVSHRIFARKRTGRLARAVLECDLIELFSRRCQRYELKGLFICFWIAITLLGCLLPEVDHEHPWIEAVPATQSLKQMVLAAESIVVGDVLSIEKFGPQAASSLPVCSEALTITYKVMVREVIRGSLESMSEHRQLVAKECIAGPNEVEQNRLLVGNTYVMFLDREMKQPIFPMSRFAIPVGREVTIPRREQEEEAYKIAAWIMSQNPDTPERAISAADARSLIHSHEWEILLENQLRLIPRSDRESYCGYLRDKFGRSQMDTVCRARDEVDENP